jgi:hypothetical protein
VPSFCLVALLPYPLDSSSCAFRRINLSPKMNTFEREMRKYVTHCKCQISSMLSLGCSQDGPQPDTWCAFRWPADSER